MFYTELGAQRNSQAVLTSIVSNMPFLGMVSLVMRSSWMELLKMTLDDGERMKAAERFYLHESAK